MKTAIIMIQGDYLQLPILKFWQSLLKIWPFKVSHVALILEHLREELLISILHNIQTLMAIHIHSLLELDMPITELVQPLTCCVLPQQLLQGDVKTWKNYFTYGHGKFLGGDGASHLLCKPAATCSFYIAVT